MTLIANPAKSFQWKIEINGFVSFECQKATLPEREIEKVEHGETNFKVKTAGLITVGDLVVEKLRRTPGLDVEAQAWFNAAQNSDSGGGGLESMYKLNIVLKQLNPDGQTVSGVWLCEGAWICKIGTSSYDRTSSENIVETLTISVDKCQQRM